MSTEADPYGCESELASPEEKLKKKKQLKRILKTEKTPEAKERVRKPNILSTLSHSTKGPSSVRYSTTKAKPIQIRNPYREINADKVATKGYLRPTYRWRLCSDLRSRIAVPEDEEDEQSGVDPEFFAIIRGRPIKDKFCKRGYTENLKKRTLNNIKSGILKDEMKRKEENTKIMLYAIKKEKEEIDSASKSMSDFLSEEQRNCENLRKELKAVEDVKKSTESKIDREKENMSNIKLRIFRQSEQMEKLRKCKEFIMQIAPEEWKRKYEDESLERRGAVKDISEKLRGAFEKFKVCCGGEDPGLESVLEDFLQEYSTAGPTKLPFDDPEKVFGLFREMELKCLQALNYNMQIRETVDIAKGVCDETDVFFDNQKAAFDEVLKDIQDKIEKEETIIEEREALLKQLQDVPLKELVSSEDVLTEHALIKNIYDEVVERPRGKLDTSEMAQEIGEVYFDLQRKLDVIPTEQREALECKARKQLTERMKEAQRVNRRKTQVENMVKGLERARAKPFVKIGRPLVFRSPPPRERIIKGIEEAKEDKTVKTLEEEIKTYFPLVWHANHPTPGPYEPEEETSDVLENYESYYPDLKLDTSESEEELLSESEDEQDPKKDKSGRKDDRKVKQKERKSEDSNDSDVDVFGTK